MDSNNFPNKAGAGERESRIYSNLVNKRNYYMGHGIGRSGDISAIQPKAAGSSLVLKLAKFLTTDALKLMGYQFISDVLLLPFATGMTLSLVLLTLAKERPEAKYVIGDEISTDLESMEKVINDLGGEKQVLCVLSTSSCFSARIPDKVEEIGKLCKKYNISHVINNAYGLQCSKTAHTINQAIKHGRVDAVVSSTDKNFMVPVGGAIVFSQNKQFIQKIANLYPGRASAGPILDMLITLLSMGKQGLKLLLMQRKENFIYLKERMENLAKKINERILETPHNCISIAMSLKQFENLDFQEEKNQLTFFGSILYSKRLMGARILTKGCVKTIEGLTFKNYGTHHNCYQGLPYMTVAGAIGMRREEIDLVIEKIEKSLVEFKQKLGKNVKVSEETVEKDEEQKTEFQEGNKTNQLNTDS